MIYISISLKMHKKEKKGGMIKNSIRCFISCILPCGALDVIRIVHCNGRVEELSGTIKASDIMKAHPKHVLKKPSSTDQDDGVGFGGGGGVPKIVVVPPDAELQRGKIYFLMPLPPENQESNNVKNKNNKNDIQRRKKKKMMRAKNKEHGDSNNNNIISVTRLVVSDGYLNDILSEKLSTHKDDRRRSRVAVWRPHLESISESPSHLY